jgi:hypothetical protein
MMMCIVTFLSISLPGYLFNVFHPGVIVDMTRAEIKFVHMVLSFAFVKPYDFFVVMKFLCC